MLAEEATLAEGGEIVGAQACKDLIGSDVVTEDGNLLGRIIEVYLSLDGHAAIYEVGRTGIRGILNRTSFISGDVAPFYSCHGRRMILPADTEKNRSSSVIAGAM